MNDLCNKTVVNQATSVGCVTFTGPMFVSMVLLPGVSLSLCAININEVYP